MNTHPLSVSQANGYLQQETLHAEKKVPGNRTMRKNELKNSTSVSTEGSCFIGSARFHCTKFNAILLI